MKKIKYGIIGAGTMAREHILNISLIDNAEVVALADPHEDSLNQAANLFEDPDDNTKIYFLMDSKVNGSVSLQLDETKKW